MKLYFLQSLKKESFYVGISHDPEARLNDRHNKKKVKSTKNLAPWVIIYTENHNSHKEARKREKYLKSYGGVKEKREIILKNKVSNCI